jgi:hypothetical protein
MENSEQDAGLQYDIIEPSSASGGGRSDVRVGMDVICADGVSIGQVKDTRERDFPVDRATPRDVYIPYHAVVEANADQAPINVLSDQIDHQGGEYPHIQGR